MSGITNSSQILYVDDDVNGDGNVDAKDKRGCTVAEFATVIKPLIDTDTVPTNIVVDGSNNTVAITMSDGTMVNGTYVPQIIPDDVYIVDSVYNNANCSLTHTLSDNSTIVVDLCDAVSEFTGVDNPNGSRTITYAAGTANEFSWTIPAPLTQSDGTVVPRGCVQPELEDECGEILRKGDAVQRPMQQTGLGSGTSNIASHPTPRQENLYFLSLSNSAYALRDPEWPNECRTLRVSTAGNQDRFVIVTPDSAILGQIRDPDTNRIYMEGAGAPKPFKLRMGESASMCFRNGSWQVTEFTYNLLSLGDDKNGARECHDGHVTMWMEGLIEDGSSDVVIPWPTTPISLTRPNITIGFREPNSNFSGPDQSPRSVGFLEQPNGVRVMLDPDRPSNGNRRVYLQAEGLKVAGW